MLQNLSKINWLSILLALVFYSFLGWLWFTVLFKDHYAMTLGKLGMMPKKPDPIYFYGPPLTILPTLIATAILMVALDIHTRKAAIELALVVGFGFLVANTFDIAINPNIPHPMPYGAISSGFHLVGILVSCLIMMAMRKK